MPTSELRSVGLAPLDASPPPLEPVEALMERAGLLGDPGAAGELAPLALRQAELERARAADAWG
jgi:hypothetical protein